jgi:hypothetical protein
MLLPHSKERAAFIPGFTLAEVMIAVATTTLFTFACFSGIIFNRFTSIKAKEEAISMDFLMHYAETVKALPFSDVTSGNAISALFDGSGGAPNIRIPASSALVALNTADYQTFHPDLLWIANRNPQMKVTLSTQTVGGVPETKQMNLAISWDAPLNRGGRLSTQLDIVRVKDL